MGHNTLLVIISYAYASLEAVSRAVERRREPAAQMEKRLRPNASPEAIVLFG